MSVEAQGNPAPNPPSLPEALQRVAALEMSNLQQEAQTCMAQLAALQNAMELIQLKAPRIQERLKAVQAEIAKRAPKVVPIDGAAKG